MISKFEKKQVERDVVFKEKQECLRAMSQCIGNMDDTSNPVIETIRATIKKLNDLFLKECLKTQNQYLDEISSMTDISVGTLKRIKTEGQTNEGTWNTPGKKRPHKPTGPSTSGAVTNISSGKRYIIVHAGSEKGFVPNALLVFSTKSKNADYHHDMNSQNFNKWISEKLIPNLSEPSVIVMDNASYHCVQINKGPTTNTRKFEIQAWLSSNGISYEDYLSREELLVLAKENKQAPVYQVDELLKQHGHEVLRLPLYHCDLNAIELVWSLAKRKVASKNIGLSAEDMAKLIEESFNSITPEDWKKNTDHVIHVEEQYKKRDGITAEMEEFIIRVRDNDSDSNSDSSFAVEFLDSDFDYSD
ncbi:uncharacterized protein LOC113237067 [Hyposmocoma kahamanoa]|uniref:uncharacterized protein LOC113237067 n=1 Tax=Hyposmocoma kahamanoa TaxID=1477025 RepID=UPI000E6D5EBA|nr:uncharacterized protein LOC113237067 [Hyposmocoma kahamanoa]